MSEEKKLKPGVGFGIMVFKDRRVLLGKRNEDAEKASSLLHGEGTWTMPGGKLHFQEGIKEGAVWELLEETGIKAVDLRVISVTNDIVYDNHFVTIGFLCEDFQGEAKIMEPEEITEWKWFSLDDLPFPIYPPSTKITKNYLDKKIYQDS